MKSRNPFWYSRGIKRILFKRVLRDREEMSDGGRGKVLTTRRSLDEIPELCETFFLRGL